MLRIIESTSAAQAKSYYSTADYYTEGQELVGQWRGKGAERLGLSGEVDAKAWESLCDNRHPQTADPLTLRTKDVRRVGYDFNFHVHKSLSVLHAITEDDRLLDLRRPATWVLLLRHQKDPITGHPEESRPADTHGDRCVGAEAGRGCGCAKGPGAMLIRSFSTEGPFDPGRWRAARCGPKRSSMIRGTLASAKGS